MPKFNDTSVTEPLITLLLALKVAFFLQPSFQKQILLEVVLYSHLNLNENVWFKSTLLEFD